jgi:pyruvate-formate lyase
MKKKLEGMSALSSCIENVKSIQFIALMNIVLSIMAISDGNIPNDRDVVHTEIHVL